MKRRYQFLLRLLAFTLTIVGEMSAYAQEQRKAPALQDTNSKDRFVDQLRRIFGRFRNADLQRVFDTARPIVCSELVDDTGEWREVAFFNEYRQFGDWYRTSLDEVRGDLAVYMFKGHCADPLSPVQVTTKFPVQESVKAYRNGRIHFHDIHVIVNAAVTARFTSHTGAYAFDLPYLFRLSNRDSAPRYALSPQMLLDRYSSDVTNRWECKSVDSADVTYDFLICRTTMLPLNVGPEIRHGRVPYGGSAFSILSDGKEAFSSVTLMFGDKAERKTDRTKCGPRVDASRETSSCPGKP